MDTAFKIPKRRKTSSLAHSYLQNLPKGTMYVSKTAKPTTPITPFKNKSKHNLIHIKTDKAKISLSTNAHDSLSPFSSKRKQIDGMRSVNEIQDILNMNDSSNGYKVVTEKEFKIISDITTKEKKLLQLVKRNEMHITSSKQQTAKVKRDLEQQCKQMIHSLQQQIQIFVSHIDDQMVCAEERIQSETQTIYKALDQCWKMKRIFKDSVNEPVSSWNELRRRSDENKSASMDANCVSFKSVKNLQINNNVDWDAVIEEFTASIKAKLNIVVTFDHHSLDSDIEINEIMKISPKQNQAIISDQFEAFNQAPSPITSDMKRECVLCPNDNAKLPIIQQQDERLECQEIDIGIIGFTREGDVHFLNMNVEVAEAVSTKDCVWNFAPIDKDVKSEDEAEFDPFYRIKYPSIVLNPASNNIYRFGGVLNGQQLQSTGCYNPTQHSWKKLAPAAIARQDAVSLMLNEDEILCVGGAAKVIQKKMCSGNNTMKVWKFYDQSSVYQIGADEWKNIYGDRLAPMNEARYGFCGLSMKNENKVIVFGGNGPNGRVKSVELFDYEENKWSYLNDIPVAKARHGCCWYNDHIVIAGGDGKSSSKQCYLYSVRRGEWTELPCLNEQRDRPIVKSYEDKSCIIVFGDGLQVQSFEILDERMDRNEWILSNVQNHPLNIDFRAGMVAM